MKLARRKERNRENHFVDINDDIPWRCGCPLSFHAENIKESFGHSIPVIRRDLYDSDIITVPNAVQKRIPLHLDDPENRKRTPAVDMSHHRMRVFHGVITIPSIQLNFITSIKRFIFSSESFSPVIVLRSTGKHLTTSSSVISPSGILFALI